MRIFHRGLGLLLACVYVYWVTHQGKGLPAVGMAGHVAYAGKAGTGFLVA
jgi:hypothetical protein